MLWTSLNRFLDLIRPRRQGAVMLVDAGLIVLALHTTYLFRMGVERWLYERPTYDSAVLLGVIVIYSVLSWALGVPRAAWRYTSFHEISRIAWVCLGAGLASAVIVLMAHLVGVPRAVLGSKSTSVPASMTPVLKLRPGSINCSRNALTARASS